MPKKKAARAVAKTTGGKARQKRKFYPVPEPPSQVTLDDLLDAAGVEVGDARVRADLELALYCARIESASEQAAKDRPSPKFLENLEKNITKTQLSLEKAEKYASTSNIGFQIIPLETGIVKALTVGILGKHKELPTIPADAMYVCIDIKNLLRAWHDNVKKVPRRKPQNPGKVDQFVIVRCAAEFFWRHSPHRPSTDCENPFAEFAARFYEALTGTEPASLEWSIRKVLGGRSAGD